ncbi:MAG: hypothetical protein GF311_28430 [Candidatus Lokiarchaeota archaeon]|nr:hypothetical protein [Candidatus Lokiarchaeota archaeon]
MDYINDESQLKLELENVELFEVIVDDNKSIEVTNKPEGREAVIIIRLEDEDDLIIPLYSEIDNLAFPENGFEYGGFILTKDTFEQYLNLDKID